MAGANGREMKRVALSTVRDDLSRYLRVAESEEVIITSHGQPAGAPIGFAAEEDWFDHRLQHDARFPRRAAAARESPRAGSGVRLEEIEAG